jgi:hypothetical protein
LFGNAQEHWSAAPCWQITQDGRASAGAQRERYPTVEFASASQRFMRDCCRAGCAERHAVTTPVRRAADQLAARKGSGADLVINAPDRQISVASDVVFQRRDVNFSLPTVDIWPIVFMGRIPHSL